MASAKQTTNRSFEIFIMLTYWNHCRRSTSVRVTGPDEASSTPVYLCIGIQIAPTFLKWHTEL